MKNVCFLSICCIFLLISCFAGAHASGTLQDVVGLSGLTVSPDVVMLAFSCEADIWTVPVDGGTARRLTIHPADDKSPTFSPDGRLIAFSSNRFGNMDVFVMDTEGGEPRRLTWHSSDDTVTQFAPSGQYIIFNSYREYREYVTWKVPVDGGEPGILCPLESNHGKLSPDEKAFLYQTGFTGGYRQGYRGPSSVNIHILDLQTLDSRKITQTTWNDRNPEWSPDGRSIYYISEQLGPQNIFRRPLDGGDPIAITALTGGYVSDLAITPDGSRVYFCLDARAHFVDGSGTVQAIPIRAPADRLTYTEERLTFSSCDAFSVSAEGDQIALVYRGDVFALDPKGGKTQPLTRTAFREKNPRWSTAGDALYYLGDRTGAGELYRLTPDDGDRKLFHKARFFSETTVFESAVPIEFFELSPDGSMVVYLTWDGTLTRRSLAGGPPETLLTGANIYSLDFSADGHWIAYLREFGGLQYDTYLMDLRTKQEYPVSRLYGHDFEVRFSADGRQLLIVSSSFCSTNIYAVWLSRLDHEKYEDDIADTPDEAGSPDDSAVNGKKTGSAGKTAEGAADKPVEPLVVDTDGIHERVRPLVRWPSNSRLPVITKDGKTLLFKSDALEQMALFAMDIKGNRVENTRKLADIDPQQVVLSKDDSKILYRTDAGIGEVEIKTGKVTPVKIEGEMYLDRVGEYRQMYTEVWSTLKYQFYDKDMHGVDWDAAYRRYLPMIERTRSAWEFRDAARRLIGELNASHLDIYGGDDPVISSIETGYIGARLGAFVDGFGYEIREVIAGTPADRVESRLHPGEYLRAVNRKRLDPAEPIAKVLNGTVDTLIELEIMTAGKKPQSRAVSLKPVIFGHYHSRSYRHWEDKNRKMVESLSGGQIGYLHIQAMSRRSLEQFRNDVFALHWEKDALIIDVRGNPGGHIHNELIRHLYGESFGTSRPRLGESQEHPDYVWRKPSVVLIDERSFSDAEVFPNGYQALGIGKVIGMPTFGGVIGTGGFKLLNNAWCRVPWVGWYTADGRNMENTGAVPDIMVEREPGEDLQGRDSQIERAVEELLK